MSDGLANTPRGLLEQQLAELGGLRNAGNRSPLFKAWRQTTLTVIQRVWPGDGSRSERFRRIPFSAPSSRATLRDMRECYERGCAEAASYLKELCAEIGDRTFRDIEAAAPPRGYEPGSAEDDFPTLELPPAPGARAAASGGPASRAPASGAPVAGSSGPRAPQKPIGKERAAEPKPRAATPAGRSEELDLARGPRGSGPGAAGGPSAAPPASAGTPDAKLPPSPAPASGSDGSARVPARPPEGGPIPAPASAAAEEVPAPRRRARPAGGARKGGKSRLKDMLGFDDRDFQEPPAATRPEPSAVPAVPVVERVPAAPAPSAAAAAEAAAASAPAPASSAPPASSRAPAAPASPPPADSGTADAGGEATEAAEFRLPDFLMSSQAGRVRRRGPAPSGGAREEPLDAPVPPARAAAPPRVAPPEDLGAEVARGVGGIPDGDPLQLSAADLAALGDPGEDRFEDEAPEALFGALNSIPEGLALSGDDFAGNDDPDWDLGPPPEFDGPGFDEPEAAVASGLFPAPGGPAVEEPPDEAEIATEEFLRRSPVLSARSRPARSRPAAAAGDAFTPAATEILGLAAAAAELGIPEGHRARVRATLTDLARSLDAGDVPWPVLREAVEFLMEFPPLARRALPLLLPYLDRAA